MKYLLLNLRTESNSLKRNKVIWLVCKVKSKCQATTDTVTFETEHGDARVCLFAQVKIDSVKHELYKSGGAGSLQWQLKFWYIAAIHIG